MLREINLLHTISPGQVLDCDNLSAKVIVGVGLSDSAVQAELLWYKQDLIELDFREVTGSQLKTPRTISGPGRPCFNLLEGEKAGLTR